MTRKRPLELVLRLARLLWRLRRSTFIEFGLLQIQSEVQSELRTRPTQKPSRDLKPVAALRIGRSDTVFQSLDAGSGKYSINSETLANAATKPEPREPEPRREIAQRFYACQMSTMARLNDLDVMRWHSGAKSDRRYLRKTSRGADHAATFACFSNSSNAEMASAAYINDGPPPI